jgi:hypothetical protein
VPQFVLELIQGSSYFVPGKTAPFLLIAEIRLSDWCFQRVMHRRLGMSTVFGKSGLWQNHLSACRTSSISNNQHSDGDWCRFY